MRASLSGPFRLVSPSRVGTPSGIDVGWLVNTGIGVRTGDTIRVISRGKLDMNADGLPPLDADGLSETPVKKGLSGYPAPTLGRYSLICWSSTDPTSKQFQGGKDKEFVVTGTGDLCFMVNHNLPDTISGGYWMIYVEKVEGVDGKPSTAEWVTIPEEYWDTYLLGETLSPTQQIPTQQIPTQQIPTQQIPTQQIPTEP